MGAGEVVVEDVESGFEGGVEGEGGDGCCEGGGGGFGGWEERSGEGEDVGVEGGEGRVGGIGCWGCHWGLRSWGCERGKGWEGGDEDWKGCVVLKTSLYP